MGKTPVAKHEIIASFLCVMGVLLIIRPPILFSWMGKYGTYTGFTFGWILITIASLSRSVAYVTFNICAKKKQDWLLLAFSSSLFDAVVGGLCFGIYYNIGYSIIPEINKDDWMLMTASSLARLASNLFWVNFCVFIPISHQSIISSFDKVWAYALSIIVFHETIYMLSIVGASEIFVAMILLASFYEPKRKKSIEIKDVILKSLPPNEECLLEEEDQIPDIKSKE